MPLRMLFYLSVLYRSVVDEEFIYRTKMIPLPAPKFFVFYNGREPCPEESTLKLSDAFSMSGDAEIRVKVFNINYNENFRLIRECRPVHDYSCFVDRVERNKRAGMPATEATIDAMEWCIDNGIMYDFLMAHRWEVFEMVSLVWDAEKAKKFYTAEAREEGRAEGRAEGREEGRVEGRVEGREEGRVEGRVEGLRESVRALMDSLQLTAEAAMTALKIPPEMQKKIAPLI